MASKQRSSESRDKGEVGSQQAATPMEKFKSLTRSLLGISREELQTEQKRYRDERSDKKRPPSSGGSRRTRK